MDNIFIIIGASKYPRAPSLNDGGQSFKYSYYELLQYLKSEYQVLPETSPSVLDLFDSGASATDMDESIARFLGRLHKNTARKDKVRNLFVFYIGHGGLRPDGQDYFLTIRATKESNQFFTSIPTDQLAKTLRIHAKECRRYIFLDACFSASAVFNFMGPEDEVVRNNLFSAKWNNIESQATGTVLFCASSRYRPAKYVDQGTMFTSALLGVLSTGDPRLPKLFSAEDLHGAILEYIAKSFGEDGVRPELHVPDQKNGQVHRVPIFRNRIAEQTYENTAVEADVVRQSVHSESTEIDSQNATRDQFSDRDETKSTDAGVGEEDSVSRRVKLLRRGVVSLIAAMLLALGSPLILLLLEKKGEALPDQVQSRDVKDAGDAGNETVQSKPVERSKSTALTGKDLYSKACAACHDSGLLNAPKLGEASAWTSRLQNGKQALYQNAINGIGTMPQRGGTNASDVEIKAAVDFMLASVPATSSSTTKGGTKKNKNKSSDKEATAQHPSSDLVAIETDGAPKFDTKTILWFVNFGKSFKNGADAQKLKNEYLAKGYPAVITRDPPSGVCNVLLGPYTHERAEEVARELFPGSLNTIDITTDSEYQIGGHHKCGGSSLVK